MVLQYIILQGISVAKNNDASGRGKMDRIQFYFYFVDRLTLEITVLKLTQLHEISKKVKSL
jgi:hypothetical protein